MSDDLLLVGRIARAHGNRGQVIVNPETDFMEERFRAGQVMLVGAADRAEPHTIREVRFHQGRPIVGFDGVSTMDDAEGMAGRELWIEASSIEPLPEGTFYRHDLVGCDVRDTEGRPLGRVTAVEGTLDRSHLVVDGDIMIPLVDGICVRVDVAAKVVVVKPPDGLVELYRGDGGR